MDRQCPWLNGTSTTGLGGSSDLPSIQAWEDRMEVSSGSGSRHHEPFLTISRWSREVVTDLEVRTTRRGRILSKAASTQRAHAGTKGAFFAGNRREKRDWQGRALPLSYS